MLKKTAILLSALLAPPSWAGETALLNASYDVTREFYNDYNPLFANYWQGKSGEAISVNQSHEAQPD